MSFRPASRVFALTVALAACLSTAGLYAAEVILPTSVIRDKVHGGWVGQTVGCTYGGPTEFRWQSTWIQDYVNIEWSDSSLLRAYRDHPGLYDDLYMDLSFLAVFDSLGPEAPTDVLAGKFANAGFTLWHANQSARWNILNGIMPPASGYWKNNPHADDIDFQIESDFIGLMCPGMPQTALDYANRVGHIMNYGDGVYGGVFVAAMYTHAFTENDIARVVELGLASLPAESRYAKCIKDVIAWHEQWPDDWRRTWFEIEKKWGSDIGCPDGALQPFNIDAVINGAYIVVGLLYGDGDMGRTIDISTRCGQDSDCNPSNAAGILGTMLGFSAIPEQWKLGLDKVENLKFSYSDYSIDSAVDATLRVAAKIVTAAGGRTDADSWIIQTQEPKAPDQVELGFEGLKPVEHRELHQDLTSPVSFNLEGSAFVVGGRMQGDSAEARCEVRIDGKLVETVNIKGNYHDRREPLFWNYDLVKGSHTVELRRVEGNGVPRLQWVLIYQ
ncbi:ADP-ribosylglycohydrolase family protein [bacterium]|nr:ADP-ribosylglycohydrolase family protein [bacterium]